MPELVDSLKNTTPLHFRSRQRPKFVNFGYNTLECSRSEPSDETNRKILVRARYYALGCRASGDRGASPPSLSSSLEA